ncbi:ATPase [Glutamicibacter creatinolyticus]
MTPLKLTKKHPQPTPAELPQPHSLMLSKRDVARLERAAKKAAPKKAKAPGLLSRLLAEGAQSRRFPGDAGWNRRGGGPVTFIENPVEIQGSAVQVCGFWPFVNGAGLPTIGVPLGNHLLRGTLVTGDPISWFLNGIISNPSAFILGQPGLGKTSLVHRLLAVLTAWGVVPMILADSRPDYVPHIRALGGQVITFSPGQGHLNPLDLGPLVASLNEIEEDKARHIAIQEMISRRRSLMEGIASMMLGRPLKAHESTCLSVAINELDPELRHAPLIGELVDFIRSRPESLRQNVLAYDDDHEYDQRLQSLLDALINLGPSGAYGDMFSKPSDAHITPGVPVVFDISGVNENDSVLVAAVQSLCWNLGSATVSAEQHLATAGKRQRRTYFLVMDELWRILRASDDMVHFIDTITRLNRGRGIGQVMITHTMNDLRLSKEHLTATAWGFVERSALVFLGGLAPSEMGNLEEVFALSSKEKALMTDWTGEAVVDPKTNKASRRPGAGHFIMKVGKNPGTPFVTQLTDLEFEISDTNRGWEMVK